jgi:transposase-like protein
MQSCSGPPAFDQERAKHPSRQKVSNITKKWTNPPITWKLAATQFAIRFGQRFFAVEI